MPESQYFSLKIFFFKKITNTTNKISNIISRHTFSLFANIYMLATINKKHWLHNSCSLAHEASYYKDINQKLCHIASLIFVSQPSYAMAINNVCGDNIHNTVHHTTYSAASVSFRFLFSQWEGLAFMSIAVLHPVPSVFHCDLPLAKHVEDVFCRSQKRFLNILASLGRSLNEPHIVEIGKLFALFRRDHTLSLHVCLVAHHHVHGAARLDVELRLCQPVLKMLKAAPFTDVIDQQHADRVSVVWPCDRPRINKDSSTSCI